MNKFICSFVASSWLEEAEFDGPAHGVVARRTGMNAVPAVEARLKEIRVRWIPHHLVEVDHIVERAFRPNPLVDLVLDTRFFRVPSRVVCRGGHVVSGNDRDTVKTDALGLDSLSD